MSALERFDDWAADLDAVLDGHDGAAPGPADSLAGVYDPATLAAIDAGTGEPDQPARARSGWRGGATAGAMMVGLVQGLQHALDDEPEPSVEIEEQRRHRGVEPVTVHLAWGDPAASVAIVRRWLL